MSSYSGRVRSMLHAKSLDRAQSHLETRKFIMAGAVIGMHRWVYVGCSISTALPYGLPCSSA